MASGFSTAQLSKYLKYLALPPEYDQFIQDPPSFPKTEESLTTLFRAQITRFPYDNLSVHYSNRDVIDILPESIYTKFMESGDLPPSRRGGYCLECSIFFYNVLLGLGYSAYTTGVRNRARIDGVPQGEFRGWLDGCKILKFYLKSVLTPAQDTHREHCPTSNWRAIPCRCRLRW